MIVSVGSASVGVLMANALSSDWFQLVVLPVATSQHRLYIVFASSSCKQQNQTTFLHCAQLPKESPTRRDRVEHQNSNIVYSLQSSVYNLQSTVYSLL